MFDEESSPKAYRLISHMSELQVNRVPNAFQCLIAYLLNQTYNGTPKSYQLLNVAIAYVAIASSSFLLTYDYPYTLPHHLSLWQVCLM